MTSYPAPVAFIVSNNKPERGAGRVGRPSRCQVQGRGESGNEGGRLVLFHRGDRCDRLTRPESTGCLLKDMTSLLRAPHGPSHLSGPFLAPPLHPVSTTAALINKSGRRIPSAGAPRGRACVCGHACFFEAKRGQGHDCFVSL